MIKIPEIMAKDIRSLLEDYYMLAMENEDYINDAGSDIESLMVRIDIVKERINEELASVAQ